jgi:hypothetical protein
MKLYYKLVYLFSGALLNTGEIEKCAVPVYLFSLQLSKKVLSHRNRLYILATPYTIRLFL